VLLPDWRQGRSQISSAQVEREYNSVLEQAEAAYRKLVPTKSTDVPKSFRALLLSDPSIVRFEVTENGSSPYFAIKALNYTKEGFDPRSIDCQGDSIASGQTYLMRCNWQNKTGDGHKTLLYSADHSGESRPYEFKLYLDYLMVKTRL